MANPQAENGHVDIANEILDALIAHRISGEEMQCLLFIIRKTWGWKKKEDRIALSQFTYATGINKQGVYRALKKLSSKKMIAVIKKDYENINSYCFIKDFERWVPVIKKGYGVIKIDKKGYSKKVNTKDTSTKEKKPILVDPPDFVSPEVWKAFLEHRKAIKSPIKTPYACSLIFKKLETWKNEKGYSPDEVLNQSIEHGWKGVFELRGNNGGGGGHKPPTIFEILGVKNGEHGTDSQPN